MGIRKGETKDIKIVIQLIKNAIFDMESREIHQWDDIYPDENIIKNDIAESNMYLYEEHETIKGIIVLNEHQENEYNEVDWKFSSGKQLVIHRLCIEPAFQRNGIAKSMVSFAEDYGRDSGYSSIRLDAFAENTGACSLYEKMGYIKSGRVKFRKGFFYCYEKYLLENKII